MSKESDEDTRRAEALQKLEAALQRLERNPYVPEELKELLLGKDYLLRGGSFSLAQRVGGGASDGGRREVRWSRGLHAVLVAQLAGLVDGGEITLTEETKQALQNTFPGFDSSAVGLCEEGTYGRRGDLVSRGGKV